MNTADMIMMDTIRPVFGKDAGEWKHRMRNAGKTHRETRAIQKWLMKEVIL